MYHGTSTKSKQRCWSKKVTAFSKGQKRISLIKTLTLSIYLKCKNIQADALTDIGKNANNDGAETSKDAGLTS